MGWLDLFNIPGVSQYFVLSIQLIIEVGSVALTKLEHYLRHVVKAQSILKQFPPSNQVVNLQNYAVPPTDT